MAQAQKKFTKQNWTKMAADKKAQEKQEKERKKQEAEKKQRQEIDQQVREEVQRKEKEEAKKQQSLNNQASPVSQGSKKAIPTPQEGTQQNYPPKDNSITANSKTDDTAHGSGTAHKLTQEKRADKERKRRAEELEKQRIIAEQAEADRNNKIRQIILKRQQQQKSENIQQQEAPTEYKGDKNNIHKNQIVQAPNNGVAQDPNNGVAQDPNNEVTQAPNNEVAQDPNNEVAQDPNNEVAQDPDDITDDITDHTLDNKITQAPDDGTDEADSRCVKNNNTPSSRVSGTNNSPLHNSRDTFKSYIYNTLEYAIPCHVKCKIGSIIFIAFYIICISTSSLPLFIISSASMCTFMCTLTPYIVLHDRDTITKNLYIINNIEKIEQKLRSLFFGINPLDEQTANIINDNLSALEIIKTMVADYSDWAAEKIKPLEPVLDEGYTIEGEEMFNLMHDLQKEKNLQQEIKEDSYPNIQYPKSKLPLSCKKCQTKLAIRQKLRLSPDLLRCNDIDFPPQGEMSLTNETKSIQGTKSSPKESMIACPTS